MLADILIGCWLNTGFRNSSCFGVLQPTDREKGFTHMLFQSCRVIFEHLFSLQKLPNDHSALTEFDIPRLNQYIQDHKDLVYIFYTKIIDVELPKMNDNQPEKRATGLSGPMSRQQNTVDKSENLDIDSNKECLKYTMHSSIARFEDMKLLCEILKKRPIVE